MPRQVVELLTYLFGEVLDGRNARIVRRNPRDFAEYAGDAAATGVFDLARPTAA